MQVLSNQVSTALRCFGGDEAAESAIFADNFNKFFDCLNVSNYTEGKQQRNRFKDPYRKKDDFRLTVS